jgi:F-box domain
MVAVAFLNLELDFLTVTTMPSIPVDVLREILEHVGKSDLPTLCRVSKIFCSCSQDVLYREIYNGDKRVIQILAKSTDLARRVRSFKTRRSPPELATALRNMSSLRRLKLWGSSDVSILDGCSFKLDSFDTNFPYSESLQQFLNSQPSIRHVAFSKVYKPMPPLDERCLPNLTRVFAPLSWLGMLIPGRPVREVMMRFALDIDLSFFTLSTTPIQKLRIHFDVLCSKPVSLLVSIFPSLVHLAVIAWDVRSTVRVPLCLYI